MFIEFEITQPIVKVQTPPQLKGADGKFLGKRAVMRMLLGQLLALRIIKIRKMCQSNR